MAVTVETAKCVGCGVCVDICPVSALALEGDKVKVSSECIDCGACVDQCPVEALKL
ncbi:MAG: 4Fe-4S binding protein [Candidatus Cloacimonetes bacterium]|nr:4Fe-4S binding protein [Candidatus Cloacimonadota bacterium]